MSAAAPAGSRGRDARAGAGRLEVVLGTQGGTGTQACRQLDLEAFAALVRSGRILGHVGRWREVVGMAASAHAIPRPLAVMACLRAMSRGRVAIEGADGSRRDVTWRACLAAARDMLADRRAAPAVLAGVEARLLELERLAAPPLRALPAAGPALVVRTDLWLGVKAGGAVAHTAGVVNALAALGRQPLLAAFEPNPIIGADVVQRLLPVPDRWWNVPELPAIAANVELEADLAGLVAEWRPAFVYHRLSAFGCAAALAARRAGLPLVVEYNGSEAWIARHWGRPLRNEALARRMEEAVLRAADRIVVVSEPLAAELAGRGIARERLRTVMNGVDTQRIHPGLAGAPARQRLGIAPDATVIGFVGSFGVWHGVPVLVEAFARLAAGAAGGSARLLLIGDGPERAAIEARVAALGLGPRVCMTGLVAQAEAPAVLAAADILVAPHVANADGSAFFGSPTKLFEYMSLGRAIVASGLDQIALVLADGRTALLVPPGDPEALAAALSRLAGDRALAARLGAAARAEAVARHDWRARVAAILA